MDDAQAFAAPAANAASFVIPEYAELRCVSNFSFLRGASLPEELVARAHKLGYAALALTDECTMAGMVRAHVAARKAGLRLLVGSQFLVRHEAPFDLVVLACNLNGYGNLCEFITSLRRSSEKGTYCLALEAIHSEALADCVVIAAPQRNATPEQLLGLARWLLRHFTGRLAGAGGHRGVGGWAPSTTRCGSISCARPASSAPSRWWPLATCTCMCARARRCRT